mmetsp:Transcript_27328/g.49158  ORF Transcript_27328/g.49158 Transcript_27328/m.49158 type:complete len:471 (+) Transcript_27328:1633-3045(+)
MTTIRLYGAHTGSHCGYCDSEGSASLGIECTKMLVEEYEALISRGWRRSGNYYYKPDLERSCCKLNTIRLNVTDFRPNKKQTKVMEKFQTYLEGQQKKASKKQKRNELKASLDGTVPEDLRLCCEQAVRCLCMELDVEFTPELVQVKRNDEARVPKFGTFTMNSALKLDALLKKIGVPLSPLELAQKLRGNINDREAQATPSGFVNFYTEATEVPKSSEVMSEPHTYTISLENNLFTQEKFELYKRYQAAVHNDTKDNADSFQRFLCSDALVRDEGDGIEQGCFHMMHRIDGRLIGFGVIDILPKGVSSVYFVYEPEFKFLSLGVVGAIKEIEFIKQYLTDDFKFYYMGYYIDTCQKMRYKAEYAPSQLLCPVTYRWVPYDACLPTKEVHKFNKLVDCLPEGSDKSVKPDMDLSRANLRDLVERCKLNVRGTELRGLQLSRELLARLAPYLMELLQGIGQTLFVKFTLEI